MPLVQDNEANVVQHGRVGSKREVQLLRRRHDDLAGAQRVLVDVTDPHAAVEGRDADAEWQKVRARICSVWADRARSGVT